MDPFRNKPGDFEKHPMWAFFSYYAKKTRLQVLMPVAMILGSIFMPAAMRKAFNAPVESIYRRADDPNVRIVIRTAKDESKGFTLQQKVMLKETLDSLPAEHVAVTGMYSGIQSMQMPEMGDFNASGFANASGMVVINTLDYEGRPIRAFRDTVTHEQGHQVQQRMLRDEDRRTWEKLHDLSKAGDFVTEYAETNQDEDFADTYREWTKDTDHLALSAINALKNGKSMLLQKYLFMAGVFANRDTHTIRTYSDPAAFGAQSFPAIWTSDDSSASGFLAPLEPESSLFTFRDTDYFRSADQFIVGNYIFWLEGNRVVRVTDLDAGLIAENLSILLPRVFLDRVPRTPLKKLEIRPMEFPDATPLDTANIQIVSPNAPSDYVPLTYEALAHEQAAAQPGHQLTVEDLTRPHGNFQIIK